MKRWASALEIPPLAQPEDPDIWSDLSNMWPTPNGDYESCDRFATSAKVNMAAVGETGNNQKYAFVAFTLTGTIAYVIANKIWEVNSGGTALTDRTNAMTVGNPFMVQFGSATFCVMGNTTATIAATGGNFSAVADAPKAECATTAANVVLAFNGDKGTLYNDGWWASDVFDYTNFSTNEAANGRLMSTPGPIKTAVSFNNQAFAFKQGSIYRGHYVGGQVKWVWEVACWNMGCPYKYGALATPHGIVFISESTYGELGTVVQIFDGSSPPVRLNPETKLGRISGTPFITYDPDKDMLVISDSAAGSEDFFYHFPTRRWGRGDFPAVTTVPVLGNGAARVVHYDPETTTRPMRWHVLSGSWDKYYSLIASDIAGESWVQSHLYGSPSQKTQFSRVTPVLTVRTDVSGGTPSASLDWTTARERDRSGGTTATVAESSLRRRFDFNVVDNYAYLQVTFTDNRVAITDLAVTMKPAGRE